MIETSQKLEDTLAAQAVLLAGLAAGQIPSMTTVEDAGLSVTGLQTLQDLILLTILPPGDLRGWWRHRHAIPLTSRGRARRRAPLLDALSRSMTEDVASIANRMRIERLSYGVVGGIPAYKASDSPKRGVWRPADSDTVTEVSTTTTEEETASKEALRQWLMDNGVTTVDRGVVASFTEERGSTQEP